MVKGKIMVFGFLTASSNQYSIQIKWTVSCNTPYTVFKCWPSIWVLCSI